MATTRLMPLHSGKGRTVAEALDRVTDYVENPEKTNGGNLVTTYQCNQSIADQEFLFSKRQYAWQSMLYSFRASPPAATP